MTSALLYLEKFKVFVGVQGLWKMFPSHRTQCLLQFESTEDDSAWQLLWACQKLENPKQKAELFAQVLEEAHHAELFRNYLSSQKSLVPFNKITLERRPLYRAKGEIWKYFPYCIVGETDASNRFEAIMSQLDEQETTLISIFKKILSDEVGHIHKAKQLTEDLAQELQIAPSVISKEINKIKRSRLLEQWLRNGKKIVEPIGSLIIYSSYYFLFFPFAIIHQLYKRDALNVSQKES